MARYHFASKLFSVFRMPLSESAGKPRMFDLSGKTALVTGASGGIGGAIARMLARQGACVGVSGTRVAALEALAREIGDTARVVPADLGSQGGAEALVAAAEAELGGIDIIVSNAGVTRDGLVMRMSDQDWHHVIEVNLGAAFRLVRASLRGMMKKRWGRIIGISSIVGTTGNLGQVNYVASKAGMMGMMKALAQEVGSRGITANCVAPGLIETDMSAAVSQDRQEAILGRIPVGRLGTPDDVAACVSYLASDEAAYVTGQTLHVNGGMAMV
jgi:3-oxoacyl-[acyl-carrier protein] reductase